MTTSDSNDDILLVDRGSHTYDHHPNSFSDQSDRRYACHRSGSPLNLSVPEMIHECQKEDVLVHQILEVFGLSIAFSSHANDCCFEEKGACIAITSRISILLSTGN